MERIKLSKTKYNNVYAICERLRDEAEKLDVALDGSVYVDDINELAERIEKTFAPKTK